MSLEKTDPEQLRGQGGAAGPPQSCSDRRERVLQRRRSLVKQEQQCFSFLCLSTTRKKGKVSWGQIARAEERAPLTSASTSFFLMPSEESSRLCSFSSSLSARSLAWRIFCRSSVASVLAFTAWQEKGGRTLMSTCIHMGAKNENRKSR